MNGSKNQRTTYLYIEYLRVLSALFVIVIHVSGANLFRIELGSSNWIIQAFYNIGARFSVCVFCMISGALLLGRGHDISINDIYGRYVKRMLICLISWIIIYALFYTIIDHEDFPYFIERLFKLPDHLWYPIMIIGLYMAYPVLSLISKNRSIVLYMIWLIILFDILTLISGTSTFFEEVAGDSKVYYLFGKFLGNLENIKASFVPGYLGLFMMGHYIHSYGLGKWHKLIVYASIPALIVSAILTVIISVYTGRNVYTFMLETNPFVVLASAGIFAFFKSKEPQLNKKASDSNFVKIMLWIGSYTFGIYLIHYAIRDILDRYFNISVATINPLIGVPVISVLIFAISLILSVIAKKIPYIKTIVT